MQSYNTQGQTVVQIFAGIDSDTKKFLDGQETVKGIQGGIDLAAFAFEGIRGGIDLEVNNCGETADASALLVDELQARLLELHEAEILDADNDSGLEEEENRSFVRRKKTFSYPDEPSDFHRDVLEYSAQLDPQNTQKRARSLRSSFLGEESVTLPPIYEVETEQGALVDMASPPKSVEFWSVETLDKTGNSSLERRKPCVEPSQKNPRVNDPGTGGSFTDGICTTSLTGTPLNTGPHHHISTANPNPDCKGLYVTDHDSIMSYYPLGSQRPNSSYLHRSFSTEEVVLCLWRRRQRFQASLHQKKV